MPRPLGSLDGLAYRHHIHMAASESFSFICHVQMKSRNLLLKRDMALPFPYSAQSIGPGYLFLPMCRHKAVGSSGTNSKIARVQWH